MSLSEWDKPKVPVLKLLADIQARTPYEPDTYALLKWLYRKGAYMVQFGGVCSLENSVGMLRGQLMEHLGSLSHDPEAVSLAQKGYTDDVYPLIFEFTRIWATLWKRSHWYTRTLTAEEHAQLYRLSALIWSLWVEPKGKVITDAFEAMVAYAEAMPLRSVRDQCWYYKSSLYKLAEYVDRQEAL